MFFNIFINDIFLSFKESELFNYADDNTILAINDIRTIKNVLTNEATLALHWFKINLMEANAEKFQFTLLDKMSVLYLLKLGMNLRSNY